MPRRVRNHGNTDHKTGETPSTITLPATAAEGTSDNVARADHAHGAPTVSSNPTMGGDVSGTASAAVVAQASTSFALPGDISPQSLVGDVNDYSPTGLSTASVLRLAGTAARNITGLAGGADGRVVKICNIGTFPLTLKHDVTSTVGNRFYCPNGVDFALLPNATVELIYDSTSSRWRVSDAAAGVGTAGTYGSGSTVAQITTDAQGRVTAAASKQPVAPLVLGCSVPGAQTSGGAGFIRYVTPFASTQSQVEIPLPLSVGGTVKNLYAELQTAPGAVAQTLLITVRKGSAGGAMADTALTCTITDPAKTANDTTHSFTVVAGDRISVSVVGSATAAAADLSVSYELDVNTA